MAEAGELAHASMVRAGMRLWSTSANVSEEGLDKEPTMQQAPCFFIFLLGEESLHVNDANHISNLEDR